MLLHFNDERTPVVARYLQCLMNLWQHFLCLLALRLEVNVDDRTDNLRDVSDNL